MARPLSTSWTVEERAAILAHVLAEVAGGRSVRKVLSQDEGMPAHSIFWQWHFADEEFQQKLALARINGVEALVDEAVDIADDSTGDYVERKREDGSTYEAFDRENVLRSKLRVETRHKNAQMLAPRKYGPKLDLTSDGKRIDLAATIARARRRVGRTESEAEDGAGE